MNRIRRWFGRLVQRPADLFDIASGGATLGFVILARWTYDNPEIAPSFSYLGDVAPTWAWLIFMGICAVAQPIVLRMDNAHLNDPRHPFMQPTKWVRCVLALLIGFWFLALFASIWSRVGPHHMESLCGLVTGMNGYIMAHVMFRPRGED